MKTSYISDSQDHISEAVFTETSLKVIQPNSLLIVVRGMILAYSFPLAINSLPVAINQDMKAIQPYENINVRYLMACLDGMKRQVLVLISSAGHGTKKFDSLDMNKVMIPVPPIELQNQFATIVEKTESLKTHYQQNLTELENLYVALSQQAFKGELDLSRVPLPEQAIHHEGHEDYEENNAENLRDLRGEPSQPPVSPSNLIQLFEDFISQQSGDFSLASFWQFAEQILLESTDDDLKPWSVADYDQVKQRLFELVKNGNIRQHFNETNNQIELSSAGGG